MLTDEQIYEACEEALKRAASSLCYVHEKDAPASFVVLTFERFNHLIQHNPNDDDFMDHGHIEMGKDD
jgi:hypothetical protein